MTIMDGGWELFSHNPHTGATTWRTAVGDQWVFRTDYDAEAILAENKAAQAHFAGRKWADGIGDPVASVPLNVYYETLLPMLQQDDKKAVARWLNDADHSAFRMRQGRV